MTRGKYAKSADGLVHLISPINGEYTLCGDAFEGSTSRHDPDYSWIDAGHGPVTCRDCAKVIQGCVGVRCKAP